MEGFHIAVVCHGCREWVGGLSSEEARAITHAHREATMQKEVGGAESCHSVEYSLESVAATHGYLLVESLTHIDE